MKTYYAGAGGGCFGSKSTVQIQVGETFQPILISEVKKGDSVRVSNGVATVKCVVRLARDRSKPLIAMPNCKLQVTPRHPIRYNRRWMRPIDLLPFGAQETAGENWVYTLVIDRCHIVLVDGVEAITWGHGLTNPLLQHPFLGTNRVLKSLQAMDGWSKGIITIAGCVRDCSSHQVVDFVAQCDKVQPQGCERNTGALL